MIAMTETPKTKTPKTEGARPRVRGWRSAQLEAMLNPTCKAIGGRKRLPKRPEDLQKIRDLDVYGFGSFPELEEMANLTALEVLRVSGDFTQLPSAISMLEKTLTNLCVSDCPLTSFPESLGHLSQLCYVNVRHCNELTSLPESVGWMEALSLVRLRHVPALTHLPESLGRAPCLKTLDLSYCETLARLPESLEQAPWEALYLYSCPSLTRLPESLGQLAMLTSLVLASCLALTSLPESLGQLAALQELILNNCDTLTRLPESLGRLAALRKLSLYGCVGLTRLPASFGALMLSELNTAWCTHEEMPRVPPGHIEVTEGAGECKWTWDKDTRGQLGRPLLRILVTILAARRREMRIPPGEVWEQLVFNAYWGA
jgi:Leucine-rich repeat (LRR) protein